MARRTETDRSIYIVVACIAPRYVNWSGHPLHNMAVEFDHKQAPTGEGESRRSCAGGRPGLARMVPELRAVLTFAPVK